LSGTNAGGGSGYRKSALAFYVRNKKNKGCNDGKSAAEKAMRKSHFFLKDYPVPAAGAEYRRALNLWIYHAFARLGLRILIKKRLLISK
jgi:hypothetical protein